MVMDKDRDEDALDRLFAAGQADTPAPSTDFLARLAADAEDALPKPARRPTPTPDPFFARFRALFAASGLSSAAALGLWIGFVAPEILNTVAPLSEDVTAISAFLPGSDLSVLSE